MKAAKKKIKKKNFILLQRGIAILCACVCVGVGGGRGPRAKTFWDPPGAQRPPHAAWGPLGAHIASVHGEEKPLWRPEVSLEATEASVRAREASGRAGEDSGRHGEA